MNGNGITATNNGADDTMDMDIDIDIDLGPDPTTEYLETEPTHPTTTTTTTTSTAFPLQQPQPDIQSTSIDLTTPLSEDATPEKVHIRGVDELTTDNIINFANEHFAEEPPTKIEWIDDTSANIVYSSPEVGLRALVALSQHVESGTEGGETEGQPQAQTQGQAQGQEQGDPTTDIAQALRLRLAKTLSSHPDSVLQVRTAVVTDRKKARAHEASRFYLMHPEYDPRERPRDNTAPRRGRGRNYGSRRYDQDEDGDDQVVGAGYNRRRFDDREHRRRLDMASDQNLTENMYDDEGDEDVDMDSDRRPRGKGRRRGRSESPMNSRRDDDGVRDRSPRSTRRHRDRYGHDERARNRGKELFSSSSSTPRKELFPTDSSNAASHEVGTSYLKGNTAAVSKHRRSIAFDAADSTASFSRRLSSSDASVPAKKSIELFPQYSSPDKERLRIKGAVRSNGTDKELHIKGTATSVRELFPSKFNPNEGKELFSDTIQGRGGRRRRAGDMFD